MALTSWPVFGLRIVGPRLVLRPILDADMAELIGLIEAGIHPPGEMPFYFAWTELPPPELQRGALQYHWRTRAEWKPTDWRLPFGVWLDGTVVGQQDVVATDFAVRRTVETGSWLGLAHQGQGIGKEMRSMVLHFAFAGLGAQRAETDAFDDNPASIAVTRSHGYTSIGDAVKNRKGEAARTVHFALDRATWVERRRDDIAIEGLDDARDMFGA